MLRFMFVILIVLQFSPPVHHIVTVPPNLLHPPLHPPTFIIGLYANTFFFVLSRTVIAITYCLQQLLRATHTMETYAPHPNEDNCIRD